MSSRSRAAAAGSTRIRTGIPGLDDILSGGLPSNRLYVVQGSPGVGKTTLSLQFLLEGVRRNESCLYITLSETEEEIREIAESHGWSLDGLHLYELSSAEQALRLEQENTLYATSDVELKETARILLAEVERTKPTRVVFDSLSEIRLLAESPMRYRRQLLGLKQHFSSRRTSVLLIDDHVSEGGDPQVESLALGVISLEQTTSSYGADLRRLRVKKLRGSPFRSGHHDYVIERGGIQVFPRLVAAEHRNEKRPLPLPTGLDELDLLLGGGLDLGTATIITGPAGAGKSVVSTLLARAAASAGLPAALFLFEERIATLLERATGLGNPLDEHVRTGAIELHQVDPAELAPDQLTHNIREAVEKRGVKLVVIDSLTGLYSAMPEARHLTLHLHELLSFLGSQGVATVLTMAQVGLVGGLQRTVDVSYLADNVILLRYFEAAGRIRKAISVVKRRTGRHEETIRELTFGPTGVHIGEPLIDFHGVLTGFPRFVGKPHELAKPAENDGVSG
jgi:circadian clock protein KaiC